MMRFGNVRGGFGMNIFSTLMIIGLIVLLIAIAGVLIYFLVKVIKSVNHLTYLMEHQARPMNPNSAPGNPISSALNILNERYARGEISEEEYNMTKSGILK